MSDSAEVVRQRWSELLGGEHGRSLGLRDGLISAYAATSRHYHGLDHIAALLALSRAYAAHLNDRAAVDLAILYHDVVYEPTRADNEARSAARARRELAAAGCRGDRASTRSRAISRRRSTRSPRRPAVSPTAISIICSISTCRFSPRRRLLTTPMPPPFAASIAIYPDLLYRPGRAKVLKAFLAAPQLYRVPALAGLWELRARENIARELVASELEERAMRDFHVPGRSVVYARNGMCATSHPAASLAAIEMLRSGGNAVDAAITAAAVLAVVEPHMTGIGGDCFALLCRPGAKPVALSAAGRAPAAATGAWYRAHGIGGIEVMSPHAVTVPGAVDGWARLLADHGTRTLAQVLAPAIGHANEGWVVAPRIAWDWSAGVAKLSRHAGARRHLLKDGRAPRAGEVMRSPALGATLARIAREGRDGFYAGEVAADMVATLRAEGGLHTHEDFARQVSTYVEPISVRYGGLDVYELPPSNQGIVALILLKMLARLGPLSRDPLAAERLSRPDGSRADRLCHAR